MNAISLLAVHGLGGSSESFDAVKGFLEPERYTVACPDLPAHGQRHTDSAVGLNECVKVIESELDKFQGDRKALVGYSLGGRIAAHVAADPKNQVDELILVSSTFGIEGLGDRATRRLWDSRNAQVIERQGIEKFIERWLLLDLWQGDSETTRRAHIAELLKCQPSALAAAFRGLGPGVIPSAWDQMALSKTRVSVICGERDSKYRRLADQILDRTGNPGELKIIKSSGHGLLREDPQQVASVIDEILG